MSEAPLPPKKDVAIALLKGPSVYVHLDPRHDEVVVPKWFKKQPQLVLQVGLNMAVSIPDLEVRDDGITATLSFSRSPFWCFMPWSAIYAIVGDDGRGMVWPEDVPGELAAKPQKPTLKVVDNKKPRKKAAKSRPGDSEAADVTDEGATEDGAAEPPTAEQPRIAILKSVPDAPEELPDELPDEPPGDSTESEPEDDKSKSTLPSYLRVIK